MIRPYIRGLLVLAAALSFCSCQQVVPEIYEIDTQVMNYYSADDQSIDHLLSIHIHVSYNERAEIEHVSILGPVETHLAWQLTPDSMFVEEDEGSVWVGSNSIAAPEYLSGKRQFPSGTYTLSVVDSMGLQADREFRIRDTVSLNPSSIVLFPRYDASSFELSIPEGTSCTLLGYDASLSPLGSLALSGERDIFELADRARELLGDQLLFFELEIIDPFLKQAFRSGMYQLPE